MERGRKACAFQGRVASAQGRKTSGTARRPRRNYAFRDQSREARNEDRRERAPRVGRGRAKIRRSEVYSHARLLGSKRVHGRRAQSSAESTRRIKLRNSPLVTN